MTFSTSADASYLLKFEKQTADGNVERYDGTLSPCNNTSCSGSPKWRATWQNTLEVGAASLSATAYYTAGYDLASTDVSNGTAASKAIAKPASVRRWSSIRTDRRYCATQRQPGTSI
ncbi:hypothetical protein U1707_05220 [Sphingomonas sp. PB2P12]|uniref:hypothetical protein n=1 Tax=Sphingomonas sandaracina TaxID=3096157 RepID=UPI002FCA5479